ncbi:MAG: hypothetical protein ACMZ7B_10915 [Balneola sp.]
MLFLKSVRDHLGSMLIVLIAFTSTLQAQEVVKFSQGKLEQNFLPYGKNFVIEGSVFVPNGEADIVNLTILRADSSKYRDYIWVRPSNTVTDFRIPVLMIDEFDENFFLVFTFLENAGFDKTKILETIDFAVGELVDQYNKGNSFDSDDILKILNDRIRESLLAVSGGNFVNIQDGKLVSGIPEFELEDSQGKLFNEIGKLVQATESKKKSLERIEKSKEKLRDINVIDFDATVDTVKILLDSIDVLKTLSLEFNILENIQSSPDVSNVDFENKLRSLVLKLSDFDSNIYTSSSSGDSLFLAKFHDESPFIQNIQKIYSELLSIRIEKNSVAENASIISNADTIIRTDPTLNLLKTRLSNFYAVNTSYTLNEYTDLAETDDTDQLRIGTAYGVAAIPINCCGSKTDWDAVSYVTLKFYWGQVDKRLKGRLRYPEDGKWGKKNSGLKSRTALTVGAVFQSELVYKGQTQTDLLGNIKPMIGLSYDISSNFEFNIGAVGFRQPSINPLATNIKNVRAALFMGFTFDINVINRVRNLTTSD